MMAVQSNDTRIASSARMRGCAQLVPPVSQLPRVAILTADIGGGHRSVARSLAEAFEGLAQVIPLYLIDDYAPFPFNAMSATYGPWVNYAPWLWRLTYRFGASRGRVEWAELATYPLVRRKISPPLVTMWPDLVISVHPLQINLPLRILRSAGNQAPFISVVTDPVSPPVAWFCSEVDLCVVATEPARRAALANGMDPAKVKVIGLPIRRAFAEIHGRSRPDARAALGLRPDLPLVLLTGGAAGIGKLLATARTITAELAGQGTPAQMAIIAGNNDALQRRLRSEHWPISVTVLGFVEDMAGWLAATDLLITKAGPTTLAEAACAGVPVLITGFIPGQETGNVTWTQEHSTGVFAPDVGQAAQLVSEWLRPGNPHLAEMAARARAIAQPEAASQVVRAALELLQRNPT
jgi:1,2-diacylglycerol 3-beta-galactosyltransferase